MERTDAEIVEATLSGSREDFGELVIRYQGYVYGLAYSLLRNWDDAQDTAQEAFIRAYIRLSQLHFPEKFANWIKQITVSLCMDRLRVLQSESQLSIPLNETDEKELPVVLPDSDQDEGLTSELALGQIGKLPRDYRIPLVLFHLNGLPYQSIANFLEISIDAVQKRVQRARQMLRKEVLKMIDDVFTQHQLNSEFAYELQALFETYELAKEDESRQTDKIDGVLAQVMKLDAYGNLVSLHIMPLRNNSGSATKELKFGPSGVPTEYYDDQGRQLKIRTEPSGWHEDPYVIIEALEEIAPGAVLGGVGVNRDTYEKATSGHYPLLVKEGLIWNLRTANCSSNMLNHTRMILPPSAIVLQCSPMPVAIWQEGDRTCVYIRQYTGESGYGYQSVAFLLPACDGSCVRDAFLLERERSPLAREIKRLFGL
jgi:RNA polymerase sigma-70 factor (ECF subfamily)